MARTLFPVLMCVALICASSPRTVSAAACPDAKQAWQLHNMYRRAHGAGLLIWYQPAVDKAQSWAQQLADNGCQLEHSDTDYRNGMGENLYWSSGTSASCSDAVNMWYAEEASYNFDTDTPFTSNEPNMGSWLHFTQIVWAETYGVGCAVGRGDNCVVVACEYQKMGNLMDDDAFARNVKPRSSSGLDRALKMGAKLKIKTSLLGARRKLSETAGRTFKHGMAKLGSGVRKMLQLSA